MVSDLLSEFTDKLLTVMIEVTKSEAKTDKDNIETDRDLVGRAASRLAAASE